MEISNLMKQSHWINVGDFKIETEEKKAVNEVLDSGRITEWEKVRQFEKDFASYLGTRYSVVLNSGTSALIAGIASLKYLDNDSIKPNSKVITSPITYIATSNSIVLNNLEPIYVDIDPISFGITPENIKAHLESVDSLEAYSLIIPVHLMGYPCDMNGINAVARKYGLRVVEDAAQSLGSLFDDKKTGTMSMFSCFSFYIAHNIQAGEMGAVATDDVRIWRLIKRIKANGRMCDCQVCTRSTGKCPRKFDDEKEDLDPRFLHSTLGYNFKTMEFQAALAQVQLRKADWIIKKRQENLKYLNEGLEELSDILQLPIYSDKVSYLAYPLVIKDNARISRKSMRSKLERACIETRPLYGCIPTQQPAYSYLREKYAGKLPNADYTGLNGFYIGCHQYMTCDNLDYIIKTFKNILK